MKETFKSDTYQGISEQIDTFIEQNEAWNWENITIVTEKVNGENGAYHWEATLLPVDTKEAMKTQLCERFEIIRHFWCKDDIRYLETRTRPLTEEEVDEIAAKVERCVDCQYGINWDYIQDIAQDVAPEAYTEQWEADEE